MFSFFKKQVTLTEIQYRQCELFYAHVIIALTMESYIKNTGNDIKQLPVVNILLDLSAKFANPLKILHQFSKEIELNKNNKVFMGIGKTVVEVCDEYRRSGGIKLGDTFEDYLFQSDNNLLYMIKHSILNLEKKGISCDDKLITKASDAVNRVYMKEWDGKDESRIHYTGYERAYYVIDYFLSEDVTGQQANKFFYDVYKNILNERYALISVLRSSAIRNFKLTPEKFIETVLLVKQEVMLNKMLSSFSWCNTKGLSVSETMIVR